MDCDVLVVGAGPAGSSAARAAAAKGADVVLIEKKRKIGVPVQCAGAIGAYLIPLLPFEIPKEMLLWRIDELNFWADGVTIRRKGGPWSSFAIDRAEFDIWLAERAVEAGAKLHLETELVGLEVVDGRVAKAKAKTKSGIEEIKTKSVVAADGVDSTVLNLLGVRKSDPIIGRAVMYELEGVELSKPNADQLFFGDFAPGGYAHVFPLSEDRANIGVGSIVSGADLQRCYKEFCGLPDVKAQLKNAKIVREKSGSVPFGPLSGERRFGNVLLAGDAAAQNIKPLVEGFLPAIICGNIAGTVAADHVSRGFPLEAYEKRLREKMGVVFEDSDRYIDVLEGIINSGRAERHLLLMGLCSNVFSLGDVVAMSKFGYPEVKQALAGWSESRTRRLKTEFIERLGVLYLRYFS